jgi:DNA polymerase theta
LTVCQAYANMGATELFEWQIQCLQSTEALTGENLVYSAPTSSGKTLVAEILMLRCQCALQCSKRVLFVVLPVSIVLDKVESLRQISNLKEVPINIQGYCSHHSVSSGNHFSFHPESGPWHPAYRSECWGIFTTGAADHED